jgi:pyruvate/2-oxoglutarate dehydrogenase complex dihydrolipoamide acyltransferase (E2) component
MAEDVIMPKLGLTMTEGLVVEWLVEDGATVTVGQPVFVVETDKSNVEVEAEAAGTLRHVVPAGETVPIETVVGRIVEAGDAGPA